MPRGEPPFPWLKGATPHDPANLPAQEIGRDTEKTEKIIEEIIGDDPNHTG